MIGGNYDKRYCGAVIAAIIVFVVILFVIGAFLLIGVSVRKHESEPFKSGMSNRKSYYEGLCEENQTALVRLFIKNKGLINNIRSSNRFDVQNVVDAYEEFLENCNKEQCPKKVYDKAREIIKYIDYGYDFTLTSADTYQYLLVYLMNMNDFLDEIIQAAKILSDTVNGDGSAYLNEVKEDYESIGEKCDPYARFADVSGLSGVQGEQYISDMHENNYLNNNGYMLDLENTWLEDNAPKGGESAFEILQKEGKIPEYDGDVFNLKTTNHKQIQDEPIIDNTEKCVGDPRYPEAGLIGVERDVHKIVDYRGRTGYHA